MKHIHLSQILGQLKRDLIGKDAHRGITLTYAWLANQTGHFALGFIPTLLALKYPYITQFILPQFYEKYPYLATSTLVTLFWIGFETYNFLGPLWFKKASKSEIVYLPDRKKVKFKPDYRHIGFDTITDILFFSLGAYLTAFLVDDSPSETLAAWISLGIFLSLVYPIIYWYQNKMYHQRAKYPIQFRLSQWNKPISDDSIKAVNRYLKNILKESGKHLFLTGEPLSGKSTLAIGIGTEFSLKMNKALYFKTLDFFDFMLADKIQNPRLWTVDESKLLVIDDLWASRPIVNEIINIEKLSTLIVQLSEEKKELLRNKNVIWVLGNNANYYALWKQTIADIIGDKNNITEIYLAK